MTVEELTAAHEDLAAIAQNLGEEWTEHHVLGRTYAKNHVEVLLADNDRERKKIERKLRKQGVRLF